MRGIANKLRMHAAGMGLLGVQYASAQEYAWEAIVLHVDGWTQSLAEAVHLGVVGSGGEVWDRTSGEFLGRLFHQGWYGARAYATRGDLYGGYLWTPYDNHAVVWFGLTNKYIDLDPRVYSEDYWTSQVYDLSDTDVVGTAYFLPERNNHAFHWLDLDDPSKFVDLHPAFALRSWAFASDGTLQGGRVTLRVNDIWQMHAALWSGSAESFVDMNPPDSQESIIEDMAPGIQVGWAVITSDGFNQHAVLWRGTPESWEDLSPTNAHDAYLFGTTGTRHVGRASIGGGFTRAGIWMSDDPDSYHNLEQYLPPEYDGSSAYGVHEEGKKIYVVGSATFESRPHATLWIGTRTDTVGSGDHRAPDGVIKRP